MKKLLASNHGLTLLEVLLTLAIMSIVSTIIYSVFITGLKLYQKIGIDGQLRDDADYAATMILNEMYDNPPSYVSNYNQEGKVGIQLVRYQAITISDKYIINDPHSEDSTDIEQDLLIYFEDDKFYLEWLKSKNRGAPEKLEISSEGSKYTTVDDGKPTKMSSSISIGSCSQNDSNGKCQHGTITLNIVIEDSNQGISSLLETEPLILKSTFGF